VEVWQTSNLRRLRLGEEKKEEEEERRTNHSMKIYMVSLLHRATIKNTITTQSTLIMKLHSIKQKLQKNKASDGTHMKEIDNKAL